MNVVILSGTIGSIKPRVTQSGAEYLSVRLAVSRYNGEESETQWFNVVVYGALQNSFKRAGVGAKVTVLGELRTIKVQDENSDMSFEYVFVQATRLDIHTWKSGENQPSSRQDIMDIAVESAIKTAKPVATTKQTQKAVRPVPAPSPVEEPEANVSEFFEDDFPF